MKWFLRISPIALAILCSHETFGQVPGTRLWKVTAPGQVISSPAVAEDGTIYVGYGSRDVNTSGQSGGGMCSFSPQGTTNWILAFPSAVMGSPAIGIDGRIYVGCYNGELKIISPAGSYTSVQLGGYLAGSAAIASDGTVYIASISNRFNKLFALTPNGAIRWVFNMTPVSFEPGSNQSPSPAIGPDGTIYLGSIDMNLYAINPDGSLRWVFPLTEISRTNTWPTYASPAIGPDGTVYIGADNGVFYALDPRGRLRWKVQAGTQFIESSAAVGTDGTIYFGCASGQVYALTDRGTLKWTFASGGISASPALGSDGSIYVGSYGGGPYFYALSPWGTNLWKFPTMDYSFSSPAIGSDGTIYFGTGTNLYALYATNSLMADSSWPMFRGNPRHTARSIQRAITRSAVLPDGTFSLDINVETGRTYQIEFSTNLVNWTELANFVSDTLTNQVIDSSAAGVPNRFYRLTTYNQISGFLKPSAR